VGKIHMPLAWRKGRGVIVTDRAVHIFNVNLKRVKIRRKMATLNRPVAVKLTGFGLKLGDERKIYAIGHRERAAMKEAAALAEQPPS